MARGGGGGQARPQDAAPGMSPSLGFSRPAPSPPAVPASPGQPPTRRPPVPCPGHCLGGRVGGWKAESAAQPVLLKHGKIPDQPHLRLDAPGWVVTVIRGHFQRVIKCSQLICKRPKLYERNFLKRNIYIHIHIHVHMYVFVYETSSNVLKNPFLCIEELWIVFFP